MAEVGSLPVGVGPLLECGGVVDAEHRGALQGVGRPLVDFGKVVVSVSCRAVGLLRALERLVGMPLRLAGRFERRRAAGSEFDTPLLELVNSLLGLRRTLGRSGKILVERTAHRYTSFTRDAWVPSFRQPPERRCNTMLNAGRDDEGPVETGPDVCSARYWD
ncbi:hypothetical protein [Mycolicibacterium chubuense]|uniref:hypothetical protein n=1 Tax=Mycolicibacterium chubuense TaxID=1800 RepID=UPI0013013DA8|nr:hypothetical protein [Mycolicibacterium chubuense]